ncbi:uncharacterized protein LOC132282726 [Cornus florida]|uniref:uncharacterized protein LOC132282726 n=1 Tax=Cornus florida TaxID=4283 RepID=UPI002896A6D4|nr:uncharacterized protein LOC132282726 [Cornus florida]XP_059640469.1 uncharacterized protein LOC132282726 [Cornus florida]
MGLKVGFLILFILSTSWVSDARELVTADLSKGETVINDFSVLQLYHQESEKEVQSSEGIVRNEKECMLCEEFATKALGHFAENKTQMEIIDILHESCSRLLYFKQECAILVDYYAPLFFLEISSVQPGDFCRKVNLCEQMVSTYRELTEDSCGLCHRAVAEVLLKLKDPDTQLEIIELLLKGCDAVENYVKKCKTLVFEYGPLILANTEQFLETADICTVLHACDSKQASPTLKTSMLSSS